MKRTTFCLALISSLLAFAACKKDEINHTYGENNLLEQPDTNTIVARIDGNLLGPAQVEYNFYSNKIQLYVSNSYAQLLLVLDTAIAPGTYSLADGAGTQVYLGMTKQGFASVLNYSIGTLTVLSNDTVQRVIKGTMNAHFSSYNSSETHVLTDGFFLARYF